MALQDQQGCVRRLLPLRRLRPCVERSKRQPRCRTQSRHSTSSSRLEVGTMHHRLHAVIGQRKLNAGRVRVDQLLRQVQERRDYSTARVGTLERNIGRAKLLLGRAARLLMKPDMKTSMTDDPNPLTTMPHSKCPACQSKHLRWLARLSQDARVHYFRCDDCAHVWNVPKTSPETPAKQTTSLFNDPPTPPTRTHR